MEPGVSPPRLDELLSPGRRFFIGIALVLGQFVFGGGALWEFLPQPLPMAVGPLIGLVPALVLARVLGVSILESYAFHWPTPPQLGWSLLAGLALIPPMRILGAFNTQFIEPPNWFIEMMEDLSPQGPEEWIANLLLVAVLVPISEELIFRGILQPAAVPTFGPARAAVIVGLIFAAFHFQPWFLLPLAVIGMVLGLVRWITGSVITCIALHGAYNLGSVVLGEVMAGGGDDGESGMMGSAFSWPRHLSVRGCAGSHWGGSGRSGTGRKPTRRPGATSARRAVDRAIPLHCRCGC